MLPGAGFHRCQPNQSKRNPAICEIQTHAVFTGKVAAWQGFLALNISVRSPRVSKGVMALTYGRASDTRVRFATRRRNRALAPKARMAMPATPGTNAARRISEQTLRREAKLCS